ncbi:MAG: hypothetical protein U5L74_02915 [Ideonella sp.]|nr:hypothetical protein [Ideonella sp.]
MIINFYRRKLAQRWALRHLHRAKASDIDAPCNTVVLYIAHELALTQVYPLLYYRQALRSDFGAQINFVPTEIIWHGAEENTACPQVRRVFVQCPLNAQGEPVGQFLRRVAATFPSAKICYLDWQAPLDVRNAPWVDPYIDAYITKQTFARRSDFDAAFLGDSNLSDHYLRRIGREGPEVRYPFPVGFESKLMLGSNFCFSPQMLDLFLASTPPRSGRRDIDVHARVAAHGDEWYAYSRQLAVEALNRLQGKRIAQSGRVSRPAFFAELRRSKLCFSPFGYGEVCWRDFEAAATGAVLLKPDSQHLTMFPQLLVKNQTYVPLAWDFDGFSEAVEQQLAQWREASAMSEAAFAVVHDHITRDEPLAPFAAVFSGHLQPHLALQTAKPLADAGPRSP